MIDKNNSQTSKTSANTSKRHNLNSASKKKGTEPSTAQKSKTSLQNFEAECITTRSLEKNANFILLSKSETSPTGHIDKPGKAVDNAKKSVMGLITFELFMKVKLMDEHIWKKAVKRGVKIKFIISKRLNKKLDSVSTQC